MAEDPNLSEIAKYKKLLSIARSSIESSQAAIATKDKQIQQLTSSLDEERSKKNGSPRSSGSGSKDIGGDGGDAFAVPRRLLRRVDANELVWVLVEFETDDVWKCFNSEQELDDFIQRVPGAALTKPPRLLSPLESASVEEESKRRSERIVEEFRRYKVRSEIALKQKDAEIKQATLRSMSNSASLMIDGSSGSGAGGNKSVSSIDTSFDNDVLKLQNQLHENDAKWKLAYEKVVRENEQLKTRGNDSILIAQWKERCDVLIREKDDLSEKVKLYEKVLREGNGGVGGQKQLELAYIGLREEFKEYKRRVQTMEKQRQNEEDLKSYRNLIGEDSSPLLSSSTSPSRSSISNGGSSNSSSSSSRDSRETSTSSSGSSSLFESKMAYIRQMVIQYMGCREAEVKLHIEVPTFLYPLFFLFFYWICSLNHLILYQIIKFHIILHYFMSLSRY
jgi:hypothetical protein